MKNRLLAITVAVFTSACGAQWTTTGECSKGAESAVEVKYLGVEKLDLWGDPLFFGRFSLTNKKGDVVRFRTWVDGDPPHAMLYERDLRLEKMKDGAWTVDSIVVEELVDPSGVAAVKSSATWTFYFEMNDFATNQNRDPTQSYRVVVRDNSGCSYASEPFTGHPRQ